MKKNEIKVSIDRAKSIIDQNTPCSAKELEQTIDDLLTASASCPPWLVIVLKVLMYALGLILAGVGTATAASCVFPNIL